VNDIVQFQEKALTAGDIRSQVNLVQEVMKAVMKDGTHFGVIPGTPKPSLWKPGAEVLAATFRIAVSYKIEDLSTEDVVRYRVAAIGTHQTSGIVMGEGMGECSSNEEKYKWRKAINAAEFAATPENRRRTKFGKQYNTDQVRTEAADLANTVLKMACKRAQVAMTLNVTAASDIFTQDIEDLPEELRPTDGEQAQKMPEYLPQDVFDAQKAGWEKAITTGKKTVDALIAWIEAKGTKMSEAQLSIVKGWKPATKAEKPADAPAIDPDDIPFGD
jgi:hypothetical protein